MNNLKFVIKTDSVLYDKQVEIANMIVDGKMPAKEDAIKNHRKLTYIIYVGCYLVEKNGYGTVSFEDIQEVRKYLIDYILNELVPSIQESRNRHKKDEFLKKLHDLLAEYDAEIGFKCEGNSALFGDCIEIRISQGGPHKTIFSTNEGSWWIDETDLRKFAK